MKKIILGALLLIPAFTWAQSNNFTLNIQVGKLNPPAKAYLFYRLNGNTVKDSAMMAGGTVKFTGAAPEPTPVQLVIDHQGVGFDKLGPRTADYTLFYIEKGTIGVIATDSVKYAAITGSNTNLDYIRYKKFIATPQDSINKLDNKYFSAGKESSRIPCLLINFWHSEISSRMI